MSTYKSESGNSLTSGGFLSERPHRRSLQLADDYMRLMQKKITRASMKILDHSTALELLVYKKV
ncbi:hypothetical protein [uncultured Nostoc sp.]|uniref:hypothetical protein n=1 Tax=uncultured Nostoc sp. TaxID=340711 RepID=UPI0035CBAC43